MRVENNIGKRDFPIRVPGNLKAWQVPRASKGWEPFENPKQIYMYLTFNPLNRHQAFMFINFVKVKFFFQVWNLPTFTLANMFIRVAWQRVGGHNAAESGFQNFATGSQGVIGPAIWPLVLIGGRSITGWAAIGRMSSSATRLVRFRQLAQGECKLRGCKCCAASSLNSTFDQAKVKRNRDNKDTNCRIHTLVSRLSVGLTTADNWSNWISLEIEQVILNDVLCY